MNPKRSNQILKILQHFTIIFYITFQLFKDSNPYHPDKYVYNLIIREQPD